MLSRPLHCYCRRAFPASGCRWLHHVSKVLAVSFNSQISLTHKPWRCIGDDARGGASLIYIGLTAHLLQTSDKNIHTYQDI